MVVCIFVIVVSQIHFYRSDTKANFHNSAEFSHAFHTVSSLAIRSKVKRRAFIDPPYSNSFLMPGKL